MIIGAGTIVYYECKHCPDKAVSWDDASEYKKADELQRIFDKELKLERKVLLEKDSFIRDFKKATAIRKRIEMFIDAQNDYG